MAQKLTDRQSQVLECIKQSIKTNGMAPTRAEIAVEMGFQSKNAASDHLKALERKGYLHLHNDRSRGIQLVQEALNNNESNVDEIPIIGSVAAGVPIEAIENIEKTVPVPQGMFRQRPTYLLRVRGDSMQDAGILDGDLIAISKTNIAKSGQIVVARIDDEVTVKTLNLEKDRAVLLPSNKAYKPIFVASGDLVIEGVFVGLIRDNIIH